MPTKIKKPNHFTLSPQTRLVLDYIKELDNGESFYAYELRREIGLILPTIYAILHRLQDWGFLESEGNRVESSSGPPRRMYRVTEEGRRFLDRR